MLTSRLNVSLLAVALLAGCYTPWFSKADNPPACPRDSLPSGACGADGTTCWYLENIGDTHRAQRMQRCTCGSGVWTCIYDFPPIDGGSDAAGGQDASGE